MRVEADKQRAIYALALSMRADRLTDREHMPFVETALECRAAMTRSAESDALCRHGGIGTFGVIRSYQTRYIDQQVQRRGFPGKCAELRVQSRARAFCLAEPAGATLFDWMHCSSSAQDLTNACAPSR